MTRLSIFGIVAAVATGVAAADRPPNIVLVMADDQGWNQMSCTGYAGVATPHLDAMAADGLRFSRFYAGGPTCSPTRASVLTGRTHFRTGVTTHGKCLRAQEVTLTQLLRDAGYDTAHFGKWHLNGFRGPGVPILAGDRYAPAGFGFDEWLSVTNFFDLDPLMGTADGFVRRSGDSSEVIVDAALNYLRGRAGNGVDAPAFVVVWYGSPHSPWRGLEGDLKDASGEDERTRNYHAELAALDRSVGTLRAGLRELGIERDTLVWYCSDNGGLKQFAPASVGGLRGHKGDVWEGGLRVPAIVEWPGRIAPGVTDTVAGVVDMLPTLLTVADIPPDVAPHRLDGIDISPLLAGEDMPRPEPLGFKAIGDASAWVDGDWKLIRAKKLLGKNRKQALFHLGDDPTETTDLSSAEPERLAAMSAAFDAWLASVADSEAGRDYESGRVDPEPRTSVFWSEADEYTPFMDDLRPLARKKK